jgi:hypothetical protein
MKSKLRLITLWVILAMLIVPAFPVVASGLPLILSPISPLSAEEATWTTTPVPLMYDPNPIPIRVEARTAAADLLSPSGATMIIDYVPNGSTNILGDTCVTFPEQAKAPFQDAANKLGALLNSAVPIRVEGCWAVLGEGVLGHSATITNYRNFTGSVPGVWYPVALANALYGSDLKPASACTNAGNPASYCNDISIAYAVDFTDYFYYGTDGNPQGQTDFESVVMHEIMHGLGFAGSMYVYGGVGFWGMVDYCDYPSSYDRFTVDSNNVNLTNLGTYPCQSVTLANALTSNNVYFTGANAKTANGNARVPLYVPNPWRGGSSYAHLAESYNGTVNALMTYSIGPGESIHDPGPIGLGVLKDVGWTAPPPTYSISGQILLSGGGAATAVTVSDGAGHTASTDGNGNYTLSGLVAGTYTITPSKAGYTFAPTNRSVTITNTNQTGIDFTATLITYSVSGQILLSGGGAATGVTVSDGAGHSAITDSSGNYTIINMIAGTYTITPSKSGYIFTPTTRSVTITTANLTGIDFTTATGCYTLTITVNPANSGTVTSNPAVGNCPGDTTKYSAGTQVALTANPSGSYTFSSWGNDASGTTNPTNVTMDANKSVTANFSNPNNNATLVVGSGSGSPMTLPITVNLSNGVLIGAATVEIQYDPAVFTIPTCTGDPGNRFDTKLCNINYDTDGVNPDRVRFSLISSNGVGGASVVLANLTFTAKSGITGSSTLNASVITLASPDGTAIPVNVTPGTWKAGVAGDVSCDNKRDAVDALYTLQHSVGLRQAAHACPLSVTSTLNIDLCDMNADSKCDAIDAMQTLQCTVGTHNPSCPVLGSSWRIPYALPLADATLSSASAQGTPGSILAIPITTDLPAGSLLGASTVEVRFDPAVVKPTGCTLDPDAHFDTKVCNLAYDNNGVNPDVVRFSMISSSGVSGHQILANITFQLIGTRGSSSPLALTAVTFADVSGSPISAVSQNGQISIPTSTFTYLPLTVKK